MKTEALVARARVAVPFAAQEEGGALVVLASPVPSGRSQCP